jgi:hypothetical protein
VLDDLDFRVDIRCFYYFIVKFLGSAVNENSSRFNALLFLEVCQITPELIDGSHGRLSLLALDNNSLVIPID